jgi:hypothetical protein
MPINLKGRSILTLGELSPAEIRFLLRLAAELKAAKTAGLETPRLKGKNIALIFEKDSTRTRTGFEMAAYDQGAHVTYLGPSGSQIGHKESVKDTARVLGRIYDAISGVPQYANRGRNRDRASIRHHVHGGDRRGVRGTSLDRLRPSREPHAHHQGCARGNSRDLTDADRRSARWQCPAASA